MHASRALDPPRGKRAVGYLRRSTDRQEQSIGDQRKAIEAYAAQHGLNVLRFYTDDAISGTSTVNRHAFQQLMSDAKRRARDFDLIIVYDVKRFGRIDNDEAGYYRHVLRTHRVEVKYITENFTGDRTDDLLRPVKQWQAREESKDLSKVTIRGLLSKSTTGTWMGGVPPHGYDLRYETSSGAFLMHLRYMPDGSKQVFDGNWLYQRTVPRGETIAVSRKDSCKLVLSEKPRQEVIRRIFTLYVEENRGFKAIADALNRDGIPSPRAVGWSLRYSGQWSCSSIRSILVNPAYMGDMVWNRRTDARFHRIVDGRAIERDGHYSSRLDLNDRSDWIVVQDAHPAIISRRVFELAKSKREAEESSRIQRGMNPRTGEPAGSTESGNSGTAWTGPKAKYLLSSLITCGRCGNRYEGHTQYRKQFDEDGRRKRTLGYACGGYIRHGKSICRMGRFAKEDLEAAVVSAVLDHYVPLTGKDARKKVERILRKSTGQELSEVAVIHEEAQKRLRQIDKTVRNLLDNITKINRHLVDQRIEELAKERELVEANIESIGHLLVTDEEHEDLVRQTVRFVSELKAVFVEHPLDQRQAAIRRCVSRIEADHEKALVRVIVQELPTVAGSTPPAGTHTIEVPIAAARVRVGS